MELSKRNTRSKRNELKRVLTAWSFILPNFLGFAIFTLIPVICSFALAFMKWDAFSAPEFIGLNNFKELVSDEAFWVALVNTFKYAIAVVPATMLISLVLAILLNRKMRGVKFFRTAFFFPYITSLVAIATVWAMMFNPTKGPINLFLQNFMADPPQWLASSDWALWVIIVVSVWQNMGYYMILYLAGLQGIPRELYEAADMDGATKWHQFWHITLPSLRPTTFLVSVMLIIKCFQIFDLIQIMTEGGPGRSTTVLVYQIYTEGFVKYNFGYASAISMVLFVIVLGITLFQFYWNARQNKV